MNKKDVILSVICGVSVSWIAIDFFGKIGWLAVIIFPILSVIGFWVVDLIGKKYLFVKQAGKFSLAGAFADVVDIKIFQLFFLFLPFPLVCKVMSFFAGTLVKYFSDKFWTFSAPGGPASGGEKGVTIREMSKFFMVAILGSAINVVAFYFFDKIKVGLPQHTWQEACIILAALVTAIWNFCGYKFVVFKK